MRRSPARMMRLVRLVQLVGLTSVLAALPAGAAWAGQAAATDEAAAPARAAPRYLLQGHDGRAVTPEDFKGRFQLVSFGFTSCPDVCPTTLLELAQVLTALGPRARHVQPLFISVDPERDSLVVLKAYTEAFDKRILGLTGSAQLLRFAADSFKVTYTKVQEPGAAAGAYTMDHSAGMFLLGPDGQLLAKIGYGTPVAAIVPRIQGWLDKAGM
jgi:protein SCO1/2